MIWRIGVVYATILFFRSDYYVPSAINLVGDHTNNGAALRAYTTNRLDQLLLIGRGAREPVKVR